jgi:hypothetical protein
VSGVGARGLANQDDLLDEVQEPVPNEKLPIELNGDTTGVSRTLPEW